MKWRVFCAVELPFEVRERASRHIEQLRSAFSYVRASWDRAEKLHITMKFVGEIEQGRVQALSEAAARAAAGASGFKLTIEGAGAFPVRGMPRVLWLGVKDHSNGLARLQSRLEEECDREGFSREQRAFRPHITIARLRSPQGARQLAARHQEMGFEAAEFAVGELTVMRSELAPGGSRYTTLSRHVLGLSGGV
jgi:2'-5' RNA ligase